jgi:hypothetical protein
MYEDLAYLIKKNIFTSSLVCSFIFYKKTIINYIKKTFIRTKCLPFLVIIVIIIVVAVIVIIMII